jgi:hypothetical protein
VCDAPNSNLSLFCAECGSSLNAPPEEGDTAEYQPLITKDEDEAQRTAAFKPGAFTNEPAPEPRADDAPVDTYQSTWEAPTSTAPPVAPAPAWSPADVTIQPQPAGSAPQGIRGFVLGVIAVFLILAVFLLWTWATLLDQDTRDSIQDFFGFIG